MGRLISNCAECHGTGLVPASPTHRWMVMDCPACAGPSESIEEQAERLRERARLLEENIGHTFRAPAREVVR
jgi:DnaJ-class molecular chaperone